jgi:RNA polymerase sigma factor (sigma-70 family)
MAKARKLTRYRDNLCRPPSHAGTRSLGDGAELLESRKQFESFVSETVALGKIANHRDFILENSLLFYSDEILGKMVKHFGEQEPAAEAFSMFKLKLAAGISGFQGTSSLRTWLHVLARSATIDYQRQRKRQPRRLDTAKEATIIDPTWSKAASFHQKTSTPPWRRTSVKQQFADVLEQLSDDEKRLLDLRVNKRLAWNVIAEQWGTLPPANNEERRKLANILKQRFSRDLKPRLRELARSAGVLDEH